MLKKVLSIFLACILTLGLVGCSQEDLVDHVSLADKVTFTLQDVWKIKNNESNTTYYYYLAEVKNNSDESYETSQISYQITDDTGNTVNMIDSNQSTPSSVIDSKQSTFVYGYVGYPNSEQENIGLQFSEDTFISFDSVDVRESDNEDIKESGKGKFVALEDDYLKITMIQRIRRIHLKMERQN